MVNIHMQSTNERAGAPGSCVLQTLHRPWSLDSHRSTLTAALLNLPQTAVQLPLTTRFQENTPTPLKEVFVSKQGLANIY